jgi:hypothetical protein
MTNEIPCITILNKKCLFFSKMENRKVKQVCLRLVPLGGGGYKERV